MVFGDGYHKARAGDGKQLGPLIRIEALGFEERFSYATSLNKLCSVDTISVLHSYGGGVQEGTRCGLGTFQPVELSKPPKK